MAANVMKIWFLLESMEQARQPPIHGHL